MTIPSSSEHPPPKLLSLDAVAKTPLSALPALFTQLHELAHVTNNAYNVFTSITSLPDIYSRLSHLKQYDEQRKLPLHGVPFSVKDNIDALPHVTTASCPSFAYTPSSSAVIVSLLESLGAVCMGKTNMDQFATGLVGTRSPVFGPVPCVHNMRFVGGGSSSGAAASVATGVVCFALGTDTAGSGRVPAAMQGIVGVKGTKGVIPIMGVVPACKSQDVVSFFAGVVNDATFIYAHVVQAVKKLRSNGTTNTDKLFHRCREIPDEFVDTLMNTANVEGNSLKFQFAIPNDDFLVFDNDDISRIAFEDALQDLKEIGGVFVEKGPDFAPFAKAARMLYEDAFVAERYASVGEVIERLKNDGSTDLDKTVTTIITEGGKKWKAAHVFNAQDVLAMLRLRAENGTWRHADVLVVPSVPCPVTKEEVDREPVERNSLLGTYTNFVNLMDLCAVAVPTGKGSDGMPRGVTIIAQAMKEGVVLKIAQMLEQRVREAQRSVF